jgi:chromosome segregation ATPase
LEAFFSLIGDYATPLIALVGTLFGGIGLEVTKRWLNRAKEKNDTAKQIRDELRTDMATLRQEVQTLKAELDKVEAEVVQWQEKYFELRSKYVTLKGLYEDALRQIQRKASSTVEQAKDAGVDLDEDL